MSYIREVCEALLFKPGCTYRSPGDLFTYFLAGDIFFLIYLRLRCIFISACGPSLVAGNRDYFLLERTGLLTAVASLVAEHGL